MFFNLSFNCKYVFKITTFLYVICSTILNKQHTFATILEYVIKQSKNAFFEWKNFRFSLWDNKKNANREGKNKNSLKAIVLKRFSLQVWGVTKIQSSQFKCFIVCHEFQYFTDYCRFALSFLRQKFEDSSVWSFSTFSCGDNVLDADRGENWLQSALLVSEVPALGLLLFFFYYMLMTAIVLIFSLVGWLRFVSIIAERLIFCSFQFLFPDDFNKELV